MQPTFSLGHLETFQEVIPLSLSLSPYVGKRRLTAKDWEAHHSTQHSAKLLHEKVPFPSAPACWTHHFPRLSPPLCLSSMFPILLHSVSSSSIHLLPWHTITPPPLSSAITWTLWRSI